MYYWEKTLSTNPLPSTSSSVVVGRLGRRDDRHWL